jgi:hypothetical protein
MSKPRYYVMYVEVDPKRRDVGSVVFPAVSDDVAKAFAESHEATLLPTSFLAKAVAYRHAEKHHAPAFGIRRVVRDEDNWRLSAEERNG